MKRMTSSRYLSAKQTRFFIAAVLLILVSFTLTSRFYTSSLVDNSFSSGLILSKDVHSEDTSRLLDNDSSLYDLIAAILLAITAFRSSYVAAVSLMEASQFTFTSASPRAPPVPQA